MKWCLSINYDNIIKGHAHAHTHTHTLWRVTYIDRKRTLHWISEAMALGMGINYIVEDAIEKKFNQEVFHLLIYSLTVAETLL